MNKKVLAIDFGASSGRAIIGSLENGRIVMEEIHRFSNDPVIVNHTMYWDVLRLFHEIKQSLIKAKPYHVDSIAVDTWGVDFALLDREGRMLENPVHYRDKRTHGMIEHARRYLSSDDLYDHTGNQIMEINTAFQLLSIKEQRPDLLKRANKLLLMPDLFHYFLSGNMCAEASIASTTQLYDQKQKNWSQPVLDAFGFPRELFADVVESGTVIGTLSEELCQELGIEAIKVIAVCGHDTQCAMAAVPSSQEEFAFLSSGTWSLLGCELKHSVIDERSKRLNITNEQGYGGKTSFLKNIIGLWLLQESRRQWIREGKEYSFAQLGKMASEAKAFQCFIDPDDPLFTPAGDIPQRIRAYCERTHQYVPKDPGEITRCIYESLALKYRHALNDLAACTGKRFTALHMIGGGTQDHFLSAMCASACGMEVLCGPIEATAFGNIAIQLMAAGAINDLDEARKIIRASEPLQHYAPVDSDAWAEVDERLSSDFKSVSHDKGKGDV